MNVFSNIPFLRILFPFVAGITFALFHVPFQVILVLILIAVILVIALQRTGSLRFTRNKWLLVGTECLLFLYGFILVPAASATIHPGYYERVIKTDSAVTFSAIIDDIPEKKKRSLKCRLKLISVVQNGSQIPVSGAIIAYFRDSGKTGRLTANKVLLVNSRLVPVPPPSNPQQFDYRSYLQNKQIFHVTFADSADFELLNLKYNDDLLWQAGLRCKEFVLKSLKDGGLSAEAYGICSALLTGYDADIDAGIMESFSHSGTLHVLSVSGLHTGLIYLVLSFLFDLADRRKNKKVLKFLFITFFLWGFALLAGFSAPVLRAVIMFNLLGFGKIFFRSGTRHQLNILCVSAFILLNWNPFLIRDVGFLLSYFAMAGLFCFQPPLSALWKPRDQVSLYCWQSITASFAATLSTLPITLFFFKQFPIWFFVCNLVVVPVTFLLLLLAFLVVIKIKLFAVVINQVVSWLIVFIDLFDSNRYGYLDFIHFTIIDLFFMSVIIMLVSYALIKRSYRLCWLTLVLLISWQIISIGRSFYHKTDKEFAVYQINRSRGLSLKNKTNVYIILDDTSQFNFQLKPHLNSFNYPLISAGIFNYISTADSKILLLDGRGEWSGGVMPEINVLVVSYNLILTGKLLSSFPALTEVVMDGSNNANTVRKAGELCRKLGLRFHDTRLGGAYLLTLK